MAKKSKWVVVATEGATTDGRTIQRNWISEMAANYDPKKYGARVNLEHIKWRYMWNDDPHSKCYGDVIGLKTEENAEGKLQLLAQIDPTDDLIKLNKDRQKIYTSIECDPNFADTGEAYLVGLAVTDNPASLGTEMLVFSAGASANPLNNRKEKADNLFTAAIETELEFVEETQSIFEKIKGLFAKKEKSDNERFSDQTQAIELLAEQTKETLEKLTALSDDLAKQKAEIEEMKAGNAEIQATFAELKKPVEPENPRPLVYGEQPETDGRFF
ncbi:TPA: GPO family capsid scaffolding protein [Haemophilus influenzae]|uniref:GPO family capsid scaffolding protein n=1 Tax=Haemophilus influenzae TaxID=727 RepID=UPI000A0BE300|nr:GPO family capsid scaffolding protein [Haemophilus influenzae]ORJ38909.1 capsid scaffolding protein [Haemophilus influenzae]PRI75344.1 Phage capsid scaffolding protein (GPO) serine peptidase [Haemophilus influenzae]PRI83597.1 Phage capsid scaffolding protein (GPO) serine peptidase [Haemophilus influenzae]PRL90537.1 Phage capsid scaffolding protein (GPO) serine peptidase [Haemophilus influenzae]PRM04833.1 Phage capsid scaffolding protein (GPO) serine peptidase [Haemophilus influenzae]